MRHQTLILACFIVNAGFATTYYVSPAGSDSANGSVATPFLTIGKGASVVSAGDSVLVSGGTYSEDNIAPATSGTQNAMIVFKPNPGTGDVIIQHPGTTIDASTPVFQLSNRDYIWIEGFQFKDFQYGQACISMSSSEGNVVINNRFENLGNSDVEGWNENSCVWVYKSIRNIVCNNYFKNIYGDGTSVNGQTAQENLVCNNTFMNFRGKQRSWGGTYLFSRAVDVQDMSDGNNVVAFNYGYDLYHHVWLDRDGSSNIILRNYGNTGSGNVFNESRCADNVVQENISVSMSVGYMSAYYETTGDTFDARWISNVAYNNTTGFNIHKSWRDEFRNNICYNNSSYNLSFSSLANSNGPHIFKNNLWYTQNKTNSVEFEDIAVSVPFFQAAVGETDGLSENPLFTSTAPGTEDFSLQPSSPAKNAADNGFDLGAFAVYPESLFGAETGLSLSGVLVDFEDVVSSVNRGGQTQFTVKLNMTSANTITVDIVPVAGDGVEDLDFTLTESTLTFTPGQVSKTVTVTGLGLFEHDEIVALTLDNTVNALPGARKLHVVRINRTPLPTAYAGVNQAVYDSDYDGSDTVSLDGSGSSDSEGTIVSYIWSKGDSQIATGPTPTVNLAVGVYTITLEVTNDQGYSDTDEVVIEVREKTGVWLEAELGSVGSLWNIEADTEASFGEYVTITPGYTSTGSVPSDTSGHITYTFNVSESGTYTMYARTICPGPDDDSFWIKMDSGSFASWNGITSSASWTWATYPSTFYLSAGSHTLTVAYREDGTLLDKLHMTNVPVVPAGIGAYADNSSEIPAAPTGLAATASAGTITLDWDNNNEPDLDGYTVKCASAPGGPYITIATDIATSEYTHTEVLSGVTFYYVVAAVDTDSNESENSEEAYAAIVGGYQESGGILSMEAEHGVLGSRWIIGTDAGASGGEYMEVDPVYDNVATTPACTTPECVVSYPFTISTGGNHRFWFRMYSDNANDDSFFWRIDDGSWVQENNRSGIGSWFSRDNAQVDVLSAGSHTLEIAYRENGTRLDKFVIQLDSLADPDGDGPPESSQSVGDQPTNCQQVQILGYRLDADLDGDCQVGIADLTLLADQWLSTGPVAIGPHYSPDIVADNEINLPDFAAIADQWLVCNDPGIAGCIKNW